MRRGGLFEIEVPQAHRVKTFIYQVVNFFLGFGLVEGTGGTRRREPGEQGAGARGNRLRERDLSKGVKREQNLQKHSFFVLTAYNPV